jgi:NAD(P) transhydrogenase subunit alpha
VTISTVGVVAEADGTEKRVALVPDTVRRLGRDGYSVVVESGAGGSAWYPDAAYVEAGARITSRSEVISQADVLVYVSAPTEEDLKALRSGQVIVGTFSPANRLDLIAELAAKEVTALSLDLVPRTVSRAQSLDVLTSQASVAGYKAVLLAAAAYGRYFPMMITAAGTSRPAAVLVLGAGVAGLSALGTARRLGAAVTGYDVRPETKTEIESMGAKFLSVGTPIEAGGSGGYARALTPEEQKAQQDDLEQRLSSFDIIITAALVPGRRPPILVSSKALAGMRTGTVVVDMASGPQGGNVEGSEPGVEIVTDNGVTVIGAANLPATVPTAASDALSQNMLAAMSLLVRDGEVAVDPSDEVHAAVVVTHQGQVVQAAIAALMTPPGEKESDERLAAF